MAKTPPSKKAIALILAGAAGLLAIPALSASGSGGAASVPLDGLWDHYSIERIKRLQPVAQAPAAQLIAAAQRAGILLRVTSGLRTFTEQAQLYAQGRTAPGPIVTNARPGQSYHNYGLALDVVEIRHGQPLWNNPRWTQIGQLGKSFGFAWGGDWQSFKDRPHFELPLGKSPAEWQRILPGGW